MLSVQRKVELTNPGESWIWRTVAEFDNDEEATDERLRGLGPGELRVLCYDAEKPAKIKVLREVKIASPSQARITDVG